MSADMKKVFPYWMVLFAAVGMLFVGCETTQNSAMTRGPWLTRYEFQIPILDVDGYPKALVQRESILRSMVASFGAVVVDHHDVVGYQQDPKNGLEKDSRWRIIVDVEGQDHETKIQDLKKKISEVFGTNDVWMVRYPVERISQ
jgi:hypothetical protein